MAANRFSTYTHFAPFFDRLIQDIGGARKHVHIQFFKYEDDEVGRQLGDLLAQKVAEGVEVRLLYDDFMCRKWRRLYRHLDTLGVHTAGFAPVHRPLPHPKDYYRNHRKVVVVDGCVAYTGGMNIAQRYRDGLDWGVWRDTMVRIEGPAAAGFGQVFVKDWMCATGQPLSEVDHPPLPGLETEQTVRVLFSDPGTHSHTLMRHTIELLDAARRYVWFESPYFIPPTEVMQALCRAARRGIDVRVLQPPRGDRGETTQWASRRTYATALDAGVRIGIYGSGFLHSKIIVSDDRTGVVSSCNIDPRSYRLCHEVAAVIEDAAYAAELREVFLADEAQSTYVDPSQWRRRPLRNRIAEGLSGIIASQL